MTRDYRDLTIADAVDGLVAAEARVVSLLADVDAYRLLALTALARYAELARQDERRRETIHALRDELDQVRAELRRYTGSQIHNSEGRAA